MYSDLDRRDIKALNRIDKRRRMKYDERVVERETNRRAHYQDGLREQHAKELRGERREVGEAQERHEGQRSRPAHRYAPAYR